MGGTVAVTMRKPDGEIVRMARWTNSMPAFVHDIRFLVKDDAYVNAYIQMWQEMREEWLRERPKATKDRKYKFPMTEAYGYYDLLAPEGYGLVVFDMFKNRILSCQGYTSFGRIHGATIKLDLMGNIGYGGPVPYEDTVVGALEGLWKAGRIEGVQELGGDGMVLNPIEEETFEELIEVLKREPRRNPDFSLDWEHPRKYECAQFMIDMSPFEITHYEETEEGFCEMREAIVTELGMSLAEEEKKQWEFINDRYQEDDV